MRDFPDIHIDVDTHSINRSVHRAVKEAMEGLDETLEQLDDLPFGRGPRRPEPLGRPHVERHREFRERRDMRDALKALERGEITVDQAMERLDEHPE